MHSNVSQYERISNQPTRTQYQHAIKASRANKDSALGLKTRDVAKGWREHVRLQLAKGGGPLFKYGSRDDKSFLNCSHPDLSVDPSKVISTQTSKWSKFSDKGQQADQQIATDIFKLMQALKDDGCIQPLRITPQDLTSAVKKYPKHSLGSDWWSPGELRQLPSIATGGLADALDSSLSLFCQAYPKPHEPQPLVGQAQWRLSGYLQVPHAVQNAVQSCGYGGPCLGGSQCLPL